MRNPLRLWRPQYDCDAPLDPARCHAIAKTREYGGLSGGIQHQCASKHKTSRPFADGAHPVCGLHARRYDDAAREAAEYEARCTQHETLSDRCEVLRSAGLPSACAYGTRQVLVDVDELERALSRTTRP